MSWYVFPCSGLSVTTRRGHRRYSSYSYRVFTPFPYAIYPLSVGIVPDVFHVGEYGAVPVPGFLLYLPAPQGQEFDAPRLFRCFAQPAIVVLYPPAPLPPQFAVRLFPQVPDRVVPVLLLPQVRTRYPPLPPHLIVRYGERVLVRVQGFQQSLQSVVPVRCTEIYRTCSIPNRVIKQVHYTLPRKPKTHRGVKPDLRIISIVPSPCKFKPIQTK
jgi:hypothetical protein